MNCHEITAESLAKALLESKQCSSCQESAAIADAIIQETIGEECKVLIQKHMLESLQDYFELSQEEARGILLVALNDSGDGDDDSDSEGSSEEEAGQEPDCSDEDDDDEDDGELIGEGECELCERLVQLTKHHLIPKSTHARIETKLMHAATAIEDGNSERARRILGHGLEHAMPFLNDTSKSSIRRVLQQTCSICRPCHSAIHNTHDNMTLALNYNTVGQLLEDERIYKFCQWASKQKPGRYAVKR